MFVQDGQPGAHPVIYKAFSNNLFHYRTVSNTFIHFGIFSNTFHYFVKESIRYFILKQFPIHSFNFESRYFILKQFPALSFIWRFSNYISSFWNSFQIDSFHFLQFLIHSRILKESNTFLHFGTVFNTSFHF